MPQDKTSRNVRIKGDCWQKYRKLLPHDRLAATILALRPGCLSHNRNRSPWPAMPQESSDKSAKAGKPASGCQIIAIGTVVFVAGLVGFVVLYIKSEQAAAARQRAASRASIVASVKSGRSETHIWDLEVLPLLADDADCRANLTSVWFDMTFVDDPADPRLDRIGELTKLQTIGFYDCRDTDRILWAAKDLPALESLTFRGAAISERGTQALSAMPNLKNLDFQQIMSQPDIDRLRELLPNVEITFAPDDRPLR